MTKQELLENCTMEQLADMVLEFDRGAEKEGIMYRLLGYKIKIEPETKDEEIPVTVSFPKDVLEKFERKSEENEKLQKAIEVKNDEIQQLKWTISNLEESNGRLQAKVDTYIDFILPRATKKAKELLDRNRFVGVRIVAIDDEKKCDCGKEDEINCLKEQLQRKETIIDQIDDILNELFGVTHDVAKPDEFKEILRTKIDNMTYFPEEPLKVADFIISAWETSWDYKCFNVSELRQIAEHLLIYCNANENEKCNNENK